MGVLGQKSHHFSFTVLHVDRNYVAGVNHNRLLSEASSLPDLDDLSDILDFE